MKKISKDLKEAVLNKKKSLDRARAQLKREFTGIDRIIDDLASSFSYWYFFPELQKKPVVINLWGLTGVGKTSLAARLTELLGCTRRFFRFNLSESEWDIRQTLSEIYDNKTSPDFILLLDEFQHVRTLDEEGREKSSKYQFIWDLLDNGMVQVQSMSFRLGELTELMAKLRKLLQLGVEVREGYVVGNEQMFMEEFGLKKSPGIRRRAMPAMNPDMKFVPSYYHEIIFEVYGEEFTLMQEVKEHLLKLNGWQTVEFLKKVISHAVAAKYLDCTKALVFIIGNLDEAFRMTTNFDTDISADEFHEESLKISLPDIKNALKERFRSEQIARLGNNHIIYPALDSGSFHKIIERELEKASREMVSEFGIRLSFDRSVKEIIYSEGVYPTQGTRPLFSTIHSIVNTQIPRIVFRLLQQPHQIDKVHIFYSDEELNFELSEKGKTVSSFSEKLTLFLESLRICRQDDMQAITAVHESGHAIISAVLMRTLPEVVCSVTTGSENEGFIYSRISWKYISKKEIVSRLAFFLDGFAAEKVVYGDENVTTGAFSDISRATHFASAMLKSCGMGGLPASYQEKHPETNLYLNDTLSKVNEDVRNLIRAGYEMAEETLTAEKPLLLRMSGYLSDNRCMKREQIREFVGKYSSQFDISLLAESGELLFYRNHLKKMIRLLDGKGKRSLPGVRNPEMISLNMNHDGI
jgi:hypothetical protein